MQSEFSKRTQKMMDAKYGEKWFRTPMFLCSKATSTISIWVRKEGPLPNHNVGVTFSKEIESFGHMKNRLKKTARNRRHLNIFQIQSKSRQHAIESTSHICQVGQKIRCHTHYLRRVTILLSHLDFCKSFM